MSCILPQNMANVQDIQVFFVIPSHMKSLSETQCFHALQLLPQNLSIIFFEKNTLFQNTVSFIFLYLYNFRRNLIKYNFYESCSD